jgi:hypothetical protein
MALNSGARLLPSGGSVSYRRNSYRESPRYWLLPCRRLGVLNKPGDLGDLRNQSPGVEKPWGWTVPSRGVCHASE